VLTGISNADSCILCQPGTYSTGSGLLRSGLLLYVLATKSHRRLTNIIIIISRNRNDSLTSKHNKDLDNKTWLRRFWLTVVVYTCISESSYHYMQVIDQLQGSTCLGQGCARKYLSTLHTIAKSHAAYANDCYSIFFDRDSYITRLSSVPGRDILDWVRLAASSLSYLGSGYCWSPIRSGTDSTSTGKSCYFLAWTLR
jgi:hypothetical protein